ncbi:MAG: hypothetical protein GX483_04835 [Actinomycetaceae bacterium]|nr:hypothetical protein [Actinomycetaceae bacterium]
MTENQNKNPSLMTLHGYGMLAWDELVELLDGFACAWGDNDGFHLDEPCPQKAPAYSHMWAWRGTSAGQDLHIARVRIDRGKAIVGILSDPGQPTLGEPTGIQSMDVSIAAGKPWGVDERRLGNGHDKEWRAREFAMLTPELPLTAQFICPVELVSELVA